MYVRSSVASIFSLAATILFAVVLTSCGTQAATQQGNSGAVTKGGTLTVSTSTPGSLDPSIMGDVAGITINHAVYEGLVYIDGSFKVQPLLATKWESSPDAKVWTFDLRPGVTFSNGDTFDSEDVLYTFKRLKDPDVGGPTVSLFENVKVEAPSANQVVFTLKNPNPEFPKDVGDYHALMLSSTGGDPAKVAVGTGPFLLKSYTAEDRALLVKNPTYWGKDADGNQLPYLDGVTIVFTPEPASQVDALRAGEAQLVYNLPAEMVESLKADPSVNVVEQTGNAFMQLRMRCDKGHVAADVRVRQALKLGTKCDDILQFARMGVGKVGNTTPVGPIYGDYYLDQPPKYDPVEAKRLLSEAGYGDGLTITLYAMNYASVPAIATTWKEQMKAIGVNVKVELVPTDVWYGEGENSWLEADFGITDWATRATPVTYFNLNLVSDGAWNETKWSDPEFDKIVAEINSEMDTTKRAELYKQAQQILIDRGPTIVPYVENYVFGTGSQVKGLELTVPESAVRLRAVYLAQ